MELFCLPLGQNPPHLVLNHVGALVQLQQFPGIDGGSPPGMLLYHNRSERSTDVSSQAAPLVASPYPLDQQRTLNLLESGLYLLLMFEIGLPAKYFEILLRLVLKLVCGCRFLLEVDAKLLILRQSLGSLLMGLLVQVLLFQLVEAGWNPQPLVLYVVFLLRLLVVEHADLVVEIVVLILIVFVLLLSQAFPEILSLDLRVEENAPLDPQKEI